MKTIAITGAGGFVGRSFTEFYKNKENIKVIPLTRKDLDLTDREAVKSFLIETSPDVVINCANEGGARKNGYVDSSAIIETNLMMVKNLTDFMRKDAVFVTFGSGAQYNKKRDLVNISEEMIKDVLPEDPYGLSKLEIGDYLKKTDNLPATIIPVIFGLFGPLEDYTFKFISNACIKNLLRLPIVINQNVRFSYLYIDDFLAIMDKILSGEKNVRELPHKEFNITPSASVTLTEIVDIINEIGDFKSEVTIKNPGLNFEYTGSNKYLKENIGDYTFLGYREAITRLYTYYKAHLSELDANAIIEDAALRFCRTKEVQK